MLLVPVTVLGFLFTLLFSGVFMYLPHHLKFLQQRAVYYLWGQEGDERLLWQWLGLSTAVEGSGAAAVASTPGLGLLHKEL